MHMKEENRPTVGLYLQVMVLWGMILCGLVGGYKCFCAVSFQRAEVSKIRMLLYRPVGGEIVFGQGQLER
jgi:hypothetical protein